MLSAPDQCEFMEMLMKMTGAKRGVEVGVFTGYSALGMALGLPEDGQLICCDISEEYVSVGRPFWEEAGVANKIETRIGPGLESLDALVADQQNLGAFDFAYIDADKGNYIHYCERLLQLLKPNGFIMLDNTLWKGKVADPEIRENDQTTQEIHACVRTLIEDDRVEVCTLMLADGFTCVRKK